MKRNNSNIHPVKKVKQNTSAKHADISESAKEITEDNKSEKEVTEDSKNAEEVIVVKQCNYKTYFKYETKNNDKIGVCLLCQEKNVIKEIKIKNSNTTGLKKHLEKSHQKAYEDLFGKTIKDKILPEKQKTINIFLNVSKY